MDVGEIIRCHLLVDLLEIDSIRFSEVVGSLDARVEDNAVEVGMLFCD